MRQSTFADREFGRADYDPDDQGEFEQGLVFVIMPYAGDDMDQSYAAIKRACKTLALRACRADENTGSGIVMREITELIERAEFIVCDLSRERPNVYYELGYAHGVGNEGPDILLVAAEGTALHFDIAPLRVHSYRSAEHLQSLVASNLAAMIRVTRR